MKQSSKAPSITWRSGRMMWFRMYRKALSGWTYAEDVPIHEEWLVRAFGELGRDKILSGEPVEKDARRYEHFLTEEGEPADAP